MILLIRSCFIIIKPKIITASTSKYRDNKTYYTGFSFNPRRDNHAVNSGIIIPSLLQHYRIILYPHSFWGCSHFYSHPVVCGKGSSNLQVGKLTSNSYQISCILFYILYHYTLSLYFIIVHVHISIAI